MVGTLIGIGTSLYSARKQAGAAKRAAAVEAKGAQQARADLAPWRDVGQSAIYELGAFYGFPAGGSGGDDGAADGYYNQENALARFTASPDYRFRLGEGVKALDSSAAARGGLLSGNQLRAVTDFGQNLAAPEYNNYLARLSELARTGQSAAAGQGAMGVEAARAVAGGIRGAAGAWAAGAAGVDASVQRGFENNLAAFDSFMGAFKTFGG